MYSVEIENEKMCLRENNDVQNTLIDWHRRYERYVFE